MVAAFEDLNLLSSRDSELWHDPRIGAAFEETMREALRQGTGGAGWDNVSWIGEWDFDLSAVTSPVLLWSAATTGSCRPRADCGCPRICPGAARRA